MFTQLVPLNSETHRNLVFSPDLPFLFAKPLAMIPLTAAELFKASRELVILFPKQGGVPQALVGVEPDNNLHVNDTGHWVGRYIPAHLRRYPFILSEMNIDEAARAETGRRFVVQFDAAAPHFNLVGGLRLFSEDGKPTDLLNNIQKILMHLQQDQERTQVMVAELDAADLLVERAIRVNRPQGEPVSLTGMRIVDTEALANLDPETTVKLRNTGTLAAVYAHLVSLTNLEDGWIAKQTAAPPAMQSDFFAEFDNDMIRFS